jgi:integrase
MAPPIGATQTKEVRSYADYFKRQNLCYPFPRGKTDSHFGHEKTKKVYRHEGGNYEKMNKTKAITDSVKVSRMAEQLCKLYHPRYGLMWVLGTFTGLRIGDLLRLRPRDIGQFVWVEEAKTKRIRGVFLPPVLLVMVYIHVIRESLHPHQFLFFSSPSRKNKPISRQWAHRIIARTAKMDGLCCIGAHSMRKIYACDIYRSTGKIEAVQAALGHRNISTSFFYIRDVLVSG